MLSSRVLAAVLLCCVVPFAALAAEHQWGHSVIYAGGSLPNVKGGESLKLYIDSRQVWLYRKTGEIAAIPANAITEVSYGHEVHRRIGTGVCHRPVIRCSGRLVERGALPRTADSPGLCFILFGSVVRLYGRQPR